MLERIFPTIGLKRAQVQRQIAEEIAARKGAEALTAALVESIPLFARDTDEDQWNTLGTGREPLDYSAHDFSAMLCAALELSYHPGGRGLLETMETFVIGDSMRVLSSDENSDVQDYWDEWADLNSWDMRSKEVFRRYLRDGEDFLRWFKPENQDGHLLLRFVEPNEIVDPAGRDNWGNHSWGIETDPDDVEKVINYYRNYGRIAEGGIVTEDKWEQIPADQMDHFKCQVDSNVKRGRSWLLGVGKYIRMHEQWLEQRFQLNRMRNLFAVIGNIKGVSTTDVATIKGKFTDTSGKTASGEGTPKKMPSNAMMLLQKGVDWDLKSLNINASDAKEDGRNIQLLISVATGLTEYIVRGDASNANFSSSMVSESPMVKMFQKYQDIWKYMQNVVHARVIRHGIVIGKLPAMSTITTEGQRRILAREIRIARRQGRSHLIEAITELAQPTLTRLKETKEGQEEIPTRLDCQVEFPPLIHRDILQETQALAIHQDREWASRQTCAATMGYDPDQESAEIAKDEKKARDRARDADKESWS